MKQPSVYFNEKKLLIALLVLIPVAYFLRINSYQLIFEEPRRALVALEMLISKDWLVPTTNGVPYYNKPPLYNWILTGFFSIFGKAEWVVRLPSILSLFLTAFIHYRISRKYIGDQAALFSALFYLTSADILFYFSLLGEIDLFYALIVYLQAIFIFHFYRQKKWHYLFISSYLLCAAGMLTKGIPSLFFQGISLLVIFIINRDFKRLFSIWHILGILILFLSAGGYFFLYNSQHDSGRYLARLFTETFSRTGIESSLTDNFRHFFNFPIQVFKIAAPWILLFVLTKGNEWKRFLKENPFLNYCLWFCIANGILYWLSPGTRERYLYMFFPFIYSLLAYNLLQKPAIEKIKGFRIFCHFIGIIVITGLIGLALFGFIRKDWIAALTCIILVISLLTILFKIKLEKASEFLLLGIILVLIARIGFGLVILPTKKEDAPYRKDAQIIAEIVGKEDIYLIGPPTKTVDEVKFAGLYFTTYKRDEPTYLTFQTSFYLSSKTGKILKYTQKKNKAGFYILEEKMLSDKDFLKSSGINQPEKIKSLYRFNNRQDKQDQWYILFK